MNERDLDLFGQMAQVAQVLPYLAAADPGGRGSALLGFLKVLLHCQLSILRVLLIEKKIERHICFGVLFRCFVV